VYGREFISEHLLSRANATAKVALKPVSLEVRGIAGKPGKPETLKKAKKSGVPVQPLVNLPKVDEPINYHSSHSRASTGVFA
jgi:hypothetical protein